MRYLL